jgi:hypothetical protein
MRILTVVALLLLLRSPAKSKDLEIFFIDVEGGQCTLIVINLVGRVSVYLVAHHGDYDSDIPALVSALRPRAAVMNNGATKGGGSAADRQRLLRGR